MKNWRDNLRNVEPYVAGEQPKMDNLIKLNTNENPYSPGNKVQEVIKKFNANKLKLYPDPDASGLKEKLADYHQLNKENIFIGNGSDEVLALVFLTCFNGDTLLFPDISYSFYPVYCDLYQIPFRKIPLRDDFSISIDDYQKECGGIIFPNPNAPTGQIVSVQDIEELVKNHQECVVVIDEAYVDFGGESVIPLIHKYDNLLVTQTFSKYRSLAGIRLGVAFGSSEVIQKLNDVKNSFNSYPVDALAQKIGEASILDSDYIASNAQKIINTRDNLINKLRDLEFKVNQSYANFIFITHPYYHAKDIFLKLRDKGIIVRYFEKERIDNYLRVSIGTQEEMDKFYEEVKYILRSV